MADETPDVVPAAAGSPLASLRARREQALAKLHTDIKVPRWDEDGGPSVFVRFGPVEQSAITAAEKRAAKSKDPDIAVLANAGLLAGACLGVFEVVDGVEVSIDPNDRDGDWPRFDDRLGALLGVDTSRAVDVVRALYFTDGDIIAVSAQLAEWAGYSTENLSREFAGN